jgi:hypothetical protein
MKTKRQNMKTNKPEILSVKYSKPSKNKLNLLMTTTNGPRKLSWDLTNHASKRISQRMRNYKSLMLVMEYGKAIFKQGLTFYIATKKSFPRNFDKSLLKELINTVVVTSNDGAILTCYKNAKSLKHIMKKQKYLANAA